jgi:hypothetical protein
MLAKITSKNQITLPKAVVEEFPGARYFEVAAAEGRIVLTPVNIGRADAVREKLASLGIREEDVSAAVTWARKRARK